MDVKKCRMLGIVSIVCAGVSLILLGAILDIVGAVIGGIALYYGTKLLKTMPNDVYAQDAVKLAKIGLVLSLVAMIANILTVVFLAPAVLEGTANVTGAMF